MREFLIVNKKSLNSHWPKQLRSVYYPLKQEVLRQGAPVLINSSALWHHQQLGLSPLLFSHPQNCHCVNGQLISGSHVRHAHTTTQSKRRERLLFNSRSQTVSVNPYQEKIRPSIISYHYRLIIEEAKFKSQQNNWFSISYWAKCRPTPVTFF